MIPAPVFAAVLFAALARVWMIASFLAIAGLVWLALDLPGTAAAEVYGLNVLVQEIEDRPDNTTRFLVIGRKAANPSESDKTTLLVSASRTDAPGALYRLLEPLAEHVRTRRQAEQGRIPLSDVQHDDTEHAIGPFGYLAGRR